MKVLQSFHYAIAAINLSITMLVFLFNTPRLSLLRTR